MVPPPPRTRLVSRVTSSWWKERGSLRTDSRRTKTRTQPRTHLGAGRANAGLLAKGPSPTNPKKNLYPDGSQLGSSLFPNLHCVATRRVSDVTQGRGCARGPRARVPLTICYFPASSQPVRAAREGEGGPRRTFWMDGLGSVQATLSWGELVRLSPAPCISRA